MPTQTSLPFPLESESATAWLQSLSSLPPANAANRLNQAWKTLSTSPLSGDNPLATMIGMVPPTLHLAQGLAVFARAEWPANAKSCKAAKLAIQLFRHASLAFARLASGLSDDAERGRVAIFYALQLAGFCLRTGARFYEAPSASLWKKSAQLYVLAEKQRWLNQAISVKVADFKNAGTLDAVFKRNLLFTLCAPNRYSETEIDQLFQFAGQTQHLLQFNRHDVGDFDFYWELTDSEPKPRRHPKWPLPKDSLAISTQRLGRALQQGEISVDMAVATRNRLAQHLLGYDQIFSSLTIGPAQPARLLTGFAAVSGYLQGEDRLSKIMRLSEQNHGSRATLHNMTLMPLEHEKSFFNQSPKSNGAGHLDSFEVRLLRSTSKQFLVAESTTGSFGNGDIALLYREQLAAKLVIIRQQTLFEDASVLLLEPIPGKIEPYAIDNPLGRQQCALLIDAESASAEIILPPGKYGTQTDIALAHFKSVTLLACVEHNPWFNRFKIRVGS